MSKRLTNKRALGRPRTKTVVFVCQPFPAHLYPHAPLMKAFEAQGWTAVLATPDKLALTAEQYRLTHVTAGIEWAVGKVADSVARRLLTDGNDAFCAEAFGHLANATKTMYPDLLRIVQELDADLIVTEPSALAGYLVGEKLGVPVIASDNGLVRLVHDLWRPVMVPRLNEARAMFGLRPEPKGSVPGHFNTLIVPTVQELLLGDLDLPGFVGFQHQNPVSKGWRLPDGVFTNPKVTKIYAMFGSTGSSIPAWRDIFDNSNRIAIAAAAALGDKVELFISVGKGNVGKYADLRGLTEDEAGPYAYRARGTGNVWVTARTAQPLALELADIALLHGGYGGLREDLTAGTPAVWAPNQTDQPDNAKRMSRNNLGVYLPNPRFATVDDMTRAIREVIARKDEISGNLHALNGRIAMLPTVEQLVRGIDLCLELGDDTFRALKRPAAGAAGGR